MAVAIALPPSVPRYLSNGMKATRAWFSRERIPLPTQGILLDLYLSSPSYPTLPAVLSIEGQGERQTQREPRTASGRTNRMNVALVQPIAQCPRLLLSSLVAARQREPRLTVLPPSPPLPVSNRSASQASRHYQSNPQELLARKSGLLWFRPQVGSSGEQTLLGYETKENTLSGVVGSARRLLHRPHAQPPHSRSIHLSIHPKASSLSPSLHTRLVSIPPPLCRSPSLVTVREIDNYLSYPCDFYPIYSPAPLVISIYSCARVRVRACVCHLIIKRQ